MTSTLRRFRFPALIALLILVVPASPALAQSDSALRRENDTLRARVGELEAELEAAEARMREMEQNIKRLEAQIERMQRAGANGDGPGELEPEKVTIDESKPDASPRALLKALKESYVEELGDLEMGNSGDRDREVYVRAVQRWAAAANRQHRGPITWHIRVVDAEPPTARGVVLTLQAVDPETDTVLGEDFPALVSNRSLLRRLESLDSSGALFNEKLELKGVLTPDVQANPNRESEGTFNNPQFIGPFAEFRFGVEAQSLRPASEVKKQNKPTTRRSS